MQWHPGLACVLQDEEGAAEPQEEHQDGTHAQQDGRRIAALPWLAGPPALVTISVTVAARRRFLPSASPTNIDDDQLGILRSHCPQVYSRFPTCSLRSIRKARYANAQRALSNTVQSAREIQERHPATEANSESSPLRFILNTEDSYIAARRPPHGHYR